MRTSPFSQWSRHPVPRVVVSAVSLASMLVAPIIVSLVVPVAASPAGAATALTATKTWEVDLNGTTSGQLDDIGQPIAESSPVEADLGGTPSVVVGDRKGYLYAFDLTTGAAIPGWAGGVTDESGPIDSTPSVTPTSGPASTIFVGSGNDADPTTGRYQAFSASGTREWFTAPQNPPSDTTPASGVQAGLSVGALQGTTAVVAGALGQETYALNASSGGALAGWPFFNSDSTHSTAALADLYGSGQTDIVEGGDQTAGTGQGQTYTNGGHIRILSANGNQVCRVDTNQTVDSSPAVGGFLAGGATGIVTGTGGYFAGASDTDTVKAYNTRCQQQWSATLDGTTESSPALTNLLGNGSMQVVEAADTAPGSTVWALNGATGQPLWQMALPQHVLGNGSVVTADLTGGRYQDVIVPTINGTYILDGKTGDQVASIGEYVGLQNAPLVTNDGNGTVGITLAGYGGPTSAGVIQHYEITVANPAEAVGSGSWPMFHHDPQLTGNAGSTTPQGSVAACDIPAAAVGTGYDLVASDGGVFAFGGAPFCGSTGNLHLNAPIAGMAMAPATGGYWLVASDGGIFAFGGAQFYGSTGGQHLNQPIVGMAATPDGGGYWLVASDGGIFAFGDAAFYGSMGGQHLNAPVVGISPSTEGNGYQLVASDGGVFSFGGAQFLGSMGGQHLNAPVVALVKDTNTGGYWEVASDGGVFSFGGAPFYGSTGNITLVAPVMGMAETSNGSGYRFVAADGGAFSYNAAFDGSMGGHPLNRPIVGMAGF